MFQGIYLNLDREPERRAHVDAMLTAAGLSQHYRRIAAVDGRTVDPSARPEKAGGIGCYRSHLAVLAEAERFDGITHVIEDDAIVSSHVLAFAADGRAAAALEQYDLLFLCFAIAPSVDMLQRFAAAFRTTAGTSTIFPLDGLPIRSTDSYLVGRRGAAKVRALLDAAGIVQPIDNQMDDLARAGQISVGLVLPFLSYVEPAIGAQSSIQGVDRDQYFLQLISRRLFYTDREVATALPDDTEIPQGLKPVLDYFRLLRTQLYAASDFV